MYGLFISHTEAGQGNFFPAKLRAWGRRPEGGGSWQRNRLQRCPSLLWFRPQLASVCIELTADSIRGFS